MIVYSRLQTVHSQPIIYLCCVPPFGPNYIQEFLLKDGANDTGIPELQFARDEIEYVFGVFLNDHGSLN